MLKRSYYSYTLLLPGLLIFAIFFMLPSLMSFYFPFTDLNNAFKVTRFVGFDNFVSVFDSEDNVLAFKNTFIFAIVTSVFKVVFGLLLAILANQKLKSVLFLRSILFLPVILSTVAVSLAFHAIFHPSRGLLNTFLHMLHLDALAMSWLTNPSIVIYSASFVEIWKWTGLTMILFLAALQSVPEEVIEAAKIDGATSWKLLRYVTLPLLGPVMNTTIILNVIGGLRVFDLIYSLTGGGPGNASSVINTMVFKAFAAGRNGEGAAANLVLFLVVLIAVLSVNKIINRQTKV